MTCEELEARLKSQKAALLRLQAEEIAYYAKFDLTDRIVSYFDPNSVEPSVRTAFNDYSEAKTAYDRVSAEYKRLGL